MLKNTRILFVPIVASLTVSSFAADDEPGQAAAESTEPQEVQAEATAWLGVATAPVDEVLAAQLDLPDNVGATVRIVVPESPAEEAGITKHDVLFEFNGELIRSPAHLSDLVGGRSAGDSVELAIIQRGKRRAITAELGARPEHLNVPGAAVDGVPGGRFQPGDLGELEFDVLPVPLEQGDLQQQFERMRERMEQQFGDLLDLEKLEMPKGLQLGGAASRTMMFSDGNGSIEIRSRDGETNVTAKDADGNVVFEGPANTDEEREKLPPHVREKLDQFQGSSFELRFDELDLDEPKLRVPRLKSDGEVEPVPPAEEDGKRIKV